MTVSVTVLVSMPLHPGLLSWVLRLDVCLPIKIQPEERCLCPVLGVLGEHLEVQVNAV